MVGYIYLIIDLLTGKKYVGQHHYDKPELDPNYHGSGTIITNIFSKRPSTLKEEYLKTCYTQEELDEWEKYFIFLYDTMSPNGYNLRDGGNGKVYSQNTLKKLSEAHKGIQSGEKHPLFGKHHSKESRKKMSESHKGRESSFKGKHHSKESRKKMSESRKGKCPSYETRKKLSEAHKGKNSKKILQYTLSGEFVYEWKSMIEIEIKLGFLHCNVSKCCCGERKSAYGFIWKFKTEKEVA